MTTFRRLTVDSVIAMANSVARNHIDASTGAQQSSKELINAIAATWELVKGRLGQSESAPLDKLINQIIGKR